MMKLQRTGSQCTTERLSLCGINYSLSNNAKKTNKDCAVNKKK